MFPRVDELFLGCGVGGGLFSVLTLCKCHEPPAWFSRRRLGTFEASL